MCATDVAPNRLAVAQQAARAFVKDQPKGTRTGLVVFSGFAQLVVAPTTDREAIVEAIDGLTTARGTAIGSAMLKSIDAIAAVNPDVEPVGDAPVTTDDPVAAAAAAGALGANGFVPDIVVLLTDGANTRGIEPLDAVPYAVERRVRVYTIGFGTVDPARLVCTAQQLGADVEGGGFGGGGGGGGGFGGRSPLRADEGTLRGVAEETGGQYYAAVDAAQLRKVFSDLPKDVEIQKESHEITVAFAALGAILAAAAVAASVRWSPYP
jgi:Ca-activated chloride channel family protein